MTRVKSAPNKALNTWLEGRPPEIRALAAEFPPGFCFAIDERRWYVVGYGETGDEQGTLLCSTYDPFDHYEAASKHYMPICPKHLRAKRQ